MRVQVWVLGLVAGVGCGGAREIDLPPELAGARVGVLLSLSGASGQVFAVADDTRLSVPEGERVYVTGFAHTAQELQFPIGTLPRPDAQRFLPPSDSPYFLLDEEGHWRAADEEPAHPPLLPAFDFGLCLEQGLCPHRGEATALCTPCEAFVPGAGPEPPSVPGCPEGWSPEPIPGLELDGCRLSAPECEPGRYAFFDGCRAVPPACSNLGPWPEPTATGRVAWVSASGERAPDGSASLATFGEAVALANAGAVDRIVIGAGRYQEPAPMITRGIHIQGLCAERTQLVLGPSSLATDGGESSLSDLTLEGSLVALGGTLHIERIHLVQSFTGIHTVNDASLSMVDSLISGSGTGLSSNGRTLQITGSVFEESMDYGLEVRSVGARIESSLFRNNRIGVYTRGAELVIRDSIVEGSVAGMVFTGTTSARIEDSLLRQGRAEAFSSGIQILGSSVSVARSQIEDVGGAGISCIAEGATESRLRLDLVRVEGTVAVGSHTDAVGNAIVWKELVPETNGHERAGFEAHGLWLVGNEGRALTLDSVGPVTLEDVWASGALGTPAITIEGSAGVLLGRISSSSEGTDGILVRRRPPAAPLIAHDLSVRGTLVGLTLSVEEGSLERVRLEATTVGLMLLTSDRSEGQLRLSDVHVRGGEQAGVNWLRGATRISGLLVEGARSGLVLDVTPGSGPVELGPALIRDCGQGLELSNGESRFVHDLLDRVRIEGVDRPLLINP